MKDEIILEDEKDLSTQLKTAWTDIHAVALQLKQSDLLQPLKPALERFELGLFRLVVMGEIKKGKSSFINALLSEPDLLPTSDDIATSTVYKLLYGPKLQYKVFLQPDTDTGNRPPPLLIPPNEVSKYGTESGNPGNRLRVDFIGVELPNPLLQQGLVLVDTPGVGGLFKSHRDITWRYAPAADAVFFVLDSVESVISQDEINFLQELTSKVTKRVYFIQTKTDIAGEEQWQGWRDRNRTVLCDKLGISKDQFFYFPVSSKLKEIADKRHSGKYLNDSGFLAVSDFLHRGLMKSKQRQLAGELSSRLHLVQKQLRMELSEQLRINNAKSKEDLDKIAGEYNDARGQFEDWHRNSYANEMRLFAKSISEAKNQSRNLLQDELDPTGPISTRILREMNSSEFDPKQLNVQAGQIQQECLAQASYKVGQIYEEFNSRVTHLLVTTINRLAEGFKMPAFQEVSLVSSNRDSVIHFEDTLGMKFNTFDEVRNAFYGFTVGGAIASAGFTLVGFLFPPAAAVAAVAAIFGGLYGAVEAGVNAGGRKREEAVARLRGALGDLLRKVQRKAMVQFDEMVSLWENRAGETLKEAAESQKALMGSRLKLIDNTRSRSLEEIQESEKSLEACRKVLERVTANLASIQKILKPAKKSNERSI